MASNISTPVNKVKIPNIADVSFSNDLYEAFENINSNFETLANHEFVKGDSGNSVEFSTINFKFLDLDGNSFEDKLKSCILNGNKNGEGEYGFININGKTYDVFSNFDPESKFGMIYEIPSNENSSKRPVNSMYYVFLDGRFANPDAKIADEDQYITLKDFSTVLVYDCNEDYIYIRNGETRKSKGAFKHVTTFPTMYYEEGVGVCWNINGAYTGIPVQGIPGKDGLNAKIHIVKAEKNGESGGENIYKVIGIHDAYSGYLSMDHKSINNVELYSDQTALVFVESNASDKSVTNNNLYFGSLFVNNNELYARVLPENAINYAASVESVIGALKGIDLYNNGEEVFNGLKGLFIPLESTGNDGEQKVHLMTATSIRNLKNDNDDLKTDIIFTPVNDINSINISKDDESVSLNIDRFLYLRLNDKCKFLNDNNINGIDLKTTSNNYLKYKLVDIITSADNVCFNPYAVNNTEGSRYYGKILDNSEIKSLNENNTCFCTILNSGQNEVSYRYSEDHYDSMPENFKKALNSDNYNNVGIYKWELYDNVEYFDIDELSSFINNDSNNGKHYMFDKKFKNIYTTTLTPSIDSDFMWFNALETVDDITGADGEYVIKYNDKYIIPGWSINNELKSFKFIKYVPIVVNDFRINNDNAFNINYNVNITGDEKNPKRNFSVHGDINTDSINVYGALNAKIINNIYTEDVITTTTGLNVLGNDGENTFSISSNGDVMANSLEVVSLNATKNVVSDEINTRSINIIDSININPSESSNISVGLSENSSVGINVINTDKINIYSENKLEYSNISDASVITSNVPIHYNSNANVVISNQASDSDVVYYKNTQVGDAGDGVSSKNYINETSFESAKNFNINRLSLIGSNNENTGNNTSIESNTISNEILKSHFEGNAYNKILCSKENSKFNSSMNCKNELNNFDNIAIQKTTIYGGSSGGRSCLNSNTDMQISFLTDFMFDIGVTAKCIKSKWPCLTNTSYLNLSLWYKIDNLDPVLVENSNVKYNFPTSKGNGNACLKTSTDNDNGYEWRGYSKDGKDLSGNYDSVCRYYTYKMKPQQMNISYTSSEYKKIVKAFNEGKNITIYVVPEFNINMHTQKDKDCLKKIEIYNIIPAAPDNITPSRNIKNILNNKNKHTTNETKSGMLLYGASVINSGNNGGNNGNNYGIPNEKITTVCNDGIVMRAGNYVFGLGYAENIVDHSYQDSEKSGNYKVDSTTHEWIATSDKFKHNIPVLFYYQRNSAGNLNTTTSEDYAKKMNAIPLEDIFNSIKYLRSVNDDLSQYGL